MAIEGPGVKIFESYESAREYILIDRHDHNQESNTEARNPAASPEVVQILRACLKGSTNEIDYTSNNDSYQYS